MLDNFYIYSDFSMRCNRRTTRGYRPHRLSLLGCRFGRSGVVGLLADFSVFVEGGIGETAQFLPLQSSWATSWEMPQ